MGSVAFEPQRGWVILNMSRLPSVTGLIPRETLKAGNPNVPDGADISEMQGTPYGLYRAPGSFPPWTCPATSHPGARCWQSTLPPAK